MTKDDVLFLVIPIMVIVSPLTFIGGWIFLGLFPGFLLVLGLVAAVAAIVMMKRHEYQQREIAALVLAERERQRKQESDRQKTLNDTRRDVISHYERIPQDLIAAEGHIDAAESEYKERVFSPFWDCVELAFKAIGSAKASIVAIGAGAHDYAAVAETVTGQIPPFPVPRIAADKLTAVSTTERRLNTIIRRAQGDPDFAKIYEMRRTNQLLQEGFPTLADAIRDAAWTITSSIDSVRSSIEDLAFESRTQQSNVEESLRAAMEMLDNIQNRRKPK